MWTFKYETAAITFPTPIYSAPLLLHCMPKESHDHLNFDAHINLHDICFISLSLSLSLSHTRTHTHIHTLSLCLCLYTYVYFSLWRVPGRRKWNTTSNSLHLTSFHFTLFYFEVNESVVLYCSTSLSYFLNLSNHISFCFGSVCTSNSHVV